MTIILFAILQTDNLIQKENVLEKKSIKNKSMKLKIISILIVVAILGGVFYWFQWRPSQIREECSKGDGIIEVLYKQCLREHGLEK